MDREIIFNHDGYSILEDLAITTVIEHNAAQDLDLLDIVVKHGRARGLKVFGNIRLNHANAAVMLEDVPGRRFGNGSGARMDFRDAALPVATGPGSAGTNPKRRPCSARSTKPPGYRRSAAHCARRCGGR